MKKIFLFISCAFLLLAFIFARHSYLIVSTGVQTTGEVVDSKAVVDAGIKINTTGVYVRYKDSEGNQRIFNTNNFSLVTSKNIQEFKVGNKVTVIYSEHNPEKVSVNTFGRLWGAAILQLVMSLFIIILMFVVSKLANSHGSAFMAHNSANSGKYLQSNATLIDVVQKINAMDDLFSLKFRIAHKDKSFTEFVTDPRKFYIEGEVITKEEAKSLIGKNIKYTHHPDDPDDAYYNSADLFEDINLVKNARLYQKEKDKETAVRKRHIKMVARVCCAAFIVWALYMFLNYVVN